MRPGSADSDDIGLSAWLHFSPDDAVYPQYLADYFDMNQFGSQTPSR
jgi:hypothetical protein